MFKIENITKIIKETYFKIKDFLLKPKSREFFIFLFFLFLASGFWLLQTLKEEYEADFTIPLVITHIPENVSLTNDPIDQLSVRIRDRGTLLANYKFRNYSPIELNFAELSKLKEDHIQLPTSIVEKEVLGRFNNTSKLVSLKPDSIEIIFTKGEPRDIPIAIRGDIQPSSDYLLTDTIIDPPFVSVVAPSYQMKEIDTIYTEQIDLSDIKDTTRLTIPLQRIKGAKYNPKEVNITIPVDILTEKTVRVPLRGVNFPIDSRLRTFPSYADITFQIGTNQYNTVSAKDFAIDIDYWELRTLSEETYKIKVTKFPSNIKRMRLSSQDRVDFLIEKKTAQRND